MQNIILSRLQKPEHENILESDPGAVNANAYDLVINGNEIGGGSIRIHDQELQSRMFRALGYSDEDAQRKFGFLMNAFQYGAPPHGGIALGFDRLCAVLSDSDSIRDFIAFPKNNAARDTMIDAPATISDEQLKELGLKNINTLTFFFKYTQHYYTLLWNKIKEQNTTLSV